MQNSQRICRSSVQRSVCPTTSWPSGTRELGSHKARPLPFSDQWLMSTAVFRAPLHQSPRMAQISPPFPIASISPRVKQPRPRRPKGYGLSVCRMQMCSSFCFFLSPNIASPLSQTQPRGDREERGADCSSANASSKLQRMQRQECFSHF